LRNSFDSSYFIIIFIIINYFGASFGDQNIVQVFELSDLQLFLLAGNLHEGQKVQPVVNLDMQRNLNQVAGLLFENVMVIALTFVFMVLHDFHVPGEISHD